MAVSALNVSNGIQNKCSFKGKWERTEQGTPYYKTNSGLKAGAVMAIPAALFWINNLSRPVTEAEYNKRVNNIENSFRKSINNIKNSDMRTGAIEGLEESLNDAKKNIPKILENNKRLKNMAIPFAVIASGLTVGCGMLVDHLRNKKAKETADLVRQIGPKTAMMQEENIELSPKGNPYYKSNTGSRYGALLGAGCGLSDALMGAGKNIRLSSALASIIPLTVGGWIMGKIADSYTNKDVRKHV